MKRGRKPGSLNLNYTRTSTGVIGISLVRTRRYHKTQLRTYFSVHQRLEKGKKRNPRFCIDTLGRQEAWRRALKARAEHEVRTAQAINGKAAA